jgi:pilus assembly protein CpaE
MNQAHILVVDDDEMIVQMMGIMLRRLEYRPTLMTSAKAALKWLRQPANFPDLILSDVMMPEISGHDFIKQVRADPNLARLPIILLTANDEMEDKIAGFQAGADDYLTKPVNPTELELRIKALLARAGASTAAAKPRQEASVISVFSLRGGVGTSSVAVNLAAALAAMWKQDIPLIDLALKNGHCALMLNVRPKNSLVNFSGWDSPTVDAENIEHLFVRHETGIKLLPAPVSPAEAELVTPDIIDLVWPTLRASYPLMVVDAGSQLLEPALTVLDRSQYIVLLLAPELAALKDTVETIRIFKQLGYDSARILPVINHIFPDGGIPKKNIEAALKLDVFDEIPSDRPAFVKAINTGRPLVATNPTAPVSAAIAALAYKLSSPKMESTAIMEPSGVLSRARKLAQVA